VDLSQQLGTLVGVDGFDIAVAIDDKSYEQIRTGIATDFPREFGVASDRLTKTWIAGRAAGPAILYLTTNYAAYAPYRGRL
jgi:hypothetical protein